MCVPLPQFLDNRVVLLPIWSCPAGARCPGPQYQTSVTVYGIRGGPGVTFTVCQAKCFVSQPNSWTEYDTPSSPFRHGLWQNVNKQKSDVFFLFCLDSILCFHNIRLAWVDFNVFIIVWVCGTPSYVWVIISSPSFSRSRLQSQLHHQHDRTKIGGSLNVPRSHPDVIL